MSWTPSGAAPAGCPSLRASRRDLGLLPRPISDLGVAGQPLRGSISGLLHPEWSLGGRAGRAPGSLPSPVCCPQCLPGGEGAAWRSSAPAAAPGASQPPPPHGARGEGGGRPPGKMKTEAGDHSMINLSVQQVLSLWAHGTVLRSLTEMWYWIFLWALFSSLFVHGAAGVLMFVMLQRHRQGRVISVIAVSIGFLASVTGAMITSAAVAGIYRVAGKNMAPLEALVWGVGQTVLTLIISFSRILATL
ncbi:transmembrane protein 170B [Phyllostomus discolor]|uniref:Transmembrane protein 170B n=3 Tax=Laurasiatheria TaxID=314145 RepID=A0A834AGL4_9CHIR|nr:transmembrane protein 170B [Phyllostomus discolor]